MSPAFQPNGTPIEPKTPSSPVDHPIYLDLTDKVNEILEVSENNEEPTNSLEFRTTKTPLPPPPPGMCIPIDYMNILPFNQSPSIVQQSATPETQVFNGIPDSTNESVTTDNHIPVEIIGKDIENQIQANQATGNCAEYVQTDSIEENNLAGQDMTDSVRLPEYMNINVPSEQDVMIVAALPKKLPAPPVPPRGDSSLAR